MFLFLRVAGLGAFETNGKKESMNNNHHVVFVKPNSTLTLNFTVSSTCKVWTSFVKVHFGGSGHCVFTPNSTSCTVNVYPHCTCSSSTYSAWGWVEDPTKENWTLTAEWNSNSMPAEQHTVVIKTYRELLQCVLL